jgi:ABC-2 type transport system ATP-binding protein
LVGLSKRIHSKVRTYSHGMRQRLALAQSLLPEPALLLLDEPTDGLDPEGIKWFREFILTLRQERGMTVLFNSHLLAEVELMCDRVAILREGRRVFEGPIGRLHEEAQTFEVELEPWSGVAPLVAANGGEILGPGRLRLPHGVDPALLVEALVRAGIRVRAFSPIHRSLEDLYMEILNDAPSPN